MRRTQALQCELPLPIEVAPTLADLPCRVCGALGVTVIALGANGSGAVEKLWCGIPCAQTQGWPWLTSAKPGQGAQRAP